MRNIRLQVSVLASILLVPMATEAQERPTRELTCARTRITRVEHRLQSGSNGPFVPDSGSAVRFANGLYQVSYEELDAVHESHNGDPVFICLIRLPQDCPPGDDRGRVYTTTNLRTLGSWTLPDSEHACGGA